MADITATLTGPVTITGELTVPMGIVPRGEIEVTENGTYDVTNYETAQVAVPQPSGTVTITENGEHDVTDYVTADVQVPQPSGSIEISENGTFDVTDYEVANVNVGGGDDALAKVLDRSIITIEVPEDTTEIGTYAFRDCTSLEEVMLPSGIASIGDYAFRGCQRLKKILLPDAVMSIGTYAFYDCKTLGDIEIPDGVSIISNYAFARSGLNSVKIGSGVTAIYSNAFNSCYTLTQITVEAVTPPTLSSGVFQGVPATCKIYVPSSSVNAYKSASGWSDRKSYINAIPE